MAIRGRCRVDKKTKNLIKRIQPFELAVINHQDLDDVAADALIAKKVKAVINTAPSISGKYPTQGPSKLLEAGIPILDNVGSKVLEVLKEGMEADVEGNMLKVGKMKFPGKLLNKAEVDKMLTVAEMNLTNELEKFAINTIDYALKEMDTVFQPLTVPPLKTVFKDKHVLIVVRGQNYREDLAAIRPYIEEVRPVLIGVDGGADALLEFGYKPDLIIGDMDSTSDAALKSGAEIVVHAYSYGYAPGQERIENLGLTFRVLPAPGTSEDVAMLLTHQSGAELIVALGTHSNIIDFLGKGRQGMASTFLVRLKVGAILVDAKGVSKLYNQKLKASYIAQLVVAALLPFAVVFLVSPNTYQLFRLLLMRMRLILGL